jgi:hypothetical protein
MNFEEQYTQETGKKTAEYFDGKELYVDFDYKIWLESTLDLEHRRRVAAERYLKSIEYIHGNTPLQEPHRRDEWQSIIKEAGE